MNIIIERSKNLSARLIQFWMIIDAIVHFKIPKRTFNHVFISHNGVIWESVDKGVIKTNYEDHFLMKKYKKGVETKSVKIDLSEDEINLVIKYLTEKEGSKYEFSNFIFHPLKTIFNKWLGSKSDYKFSCLELVIRALNNSGKYNLNPFLNPREFSELFFK